MRKFGEAFKFSKPKGSGVPISPGCYLTVLSAKAALPSILVLINPKGEGGAVAGMGVPLAAGATKADLAEPMRRGVYALSSPDRKTVLKLMVMPKEEAGFDTGAFTASAAAKLLDQEVRVRISSTWEVMQLTFESYDPMTYPALDFFLGVAKRLAELTDGVVADPVSQVYRLPERVFSPRPAGEPVAAADHVVVHDRDHEGARHVYTLGLTKFDHPEVEVYGVSVDVAGPCARFLLGLSQSVLMGARLEAGATVGSKEAPLKVAAGGLDRALWEGVPCLELLPEQGTSPDRAITTWVTSLP